MQLQIRHFEWPFANVFPEVHRKQGPHQKVFADASRNSRQIAIHRVLAAFVKSLFEALRAWSLERSKMSHWANIVAHGETIAWTYRIHGAGNRHCPHSDPFCLPFPTFDSLFMLALSGYLDARSNSLHMIHIVFANQCNIQFILNYSRLERCCI